MITESIIALDVGGSAVKSGLVTVEKQLTQMSISTLRQTPINSGGQADQILDTLHEVIAGYLRESNSQQLAIAFPGPCDYQTGVCYIEGLTKYHALYGLNLIESLYSYPDLARLEIHFCNDAEAAIAGEARYGSGRGYSRLIGVTLGTGCGSAYVIDGHPQLSGDGVPHNGWLYPMLYRDARADDLFSVRGLTARFARAGQSAGSLADLTNRARSGSANELQILESFGDDLGQFLAPYVNLFSADAILILGGIANAFDLFGSALQKHLVIPAHTGQLSIAAALYGATAEVIYKR